MLRRVLSLIEDTGGAPTFGLFTTLLGLTETLFYANIPNLELLASVPAFITLISAYCSLESNKYLEERAGEEGFHIIAPSLTIPAAAIILSQFSNYLSEMTCQYSH